MTSQKKSRGGGLHRDMLHYISHSCLMKGVSIDVRQVGIWLVLAAHFMESFHEDGGRSCICIVLKKITPQVSISTFF